MRKVNRSALVPYSAEQMFALVDDVESYPEFLPWCNDTVVHYRGENVVEATLEMHHGKLSKHFRTRNTSTPGQAMDIALVDGPFRQLAGGWRFTQLGETGCKVVLEIEFDFASRIVDAVFGAFFEDTCNALVDAFTCRANQIYGTQQQEHER